jgi:hypothetical protein
VRTRGALVALAAAVALQAGLSVDAMRGQSATFDEGAHLPAGYTHLALGDHRLNPEQPPLVKLLAAAPLLAVRPAMRTDDRAWAEARQWEFGRRFLYRWNDGDRLLFLGRLPIVALASCLVAAVFFETRRRFSPPAAAVAAFLAALSPEVLAHGSIVTTDLAFALFFFLSVVAFDRALAQPSAVRWLAAGLAAGAAFAAKLSAPILVPVLAALVLAAVAQRRAVAWRRAGLGLLAIAALVVVVVWAAYGFSPALTSDPALRSELRASGLDASAAGPAARAAVAAARAFLVPEDYARGVVFVMTHSEARATFLDGALSERGFPAYFLFTTLYKTPIPLLVLAAVALARVPRLRRNDATFLWLPVAVYLAFTFTRGLQIGHRHLLPLLPFVLVAAGEAAAALLASRRVVVCGAVAALGVWYAAGTLLTHPHHLAYFNEIAGGPANGYRHLVDSNLDWGQDLKRLAAWAKQAGDPPLKLSYFGSADPAYYGLASEALPGYTAPHAARVTREIAPGDLLAISATNLQGVYLDPVDRPLMERIRRLAPVARVGFSIFVYRADFTWPEPAGGGPAGTTAGPARADAPAGGGAR